MANGVEMTEIKYWFGCYAQCFCSVLAMEKESVPRECPDHGNGLVESVTPMDAEPGCPLGLKPDGWSREPGTVVVDLPA